MKHKHHDLIIQWAKGARIQFYSPASHKWIDCVGTPQWHPNGQYRVEPDWVKLRIAEHSYVDRNRFEVHEEKDWDAVERMATFVRWKSPSFSVESIN